jgi:nucleoside-diphosphate-sugar epimerase
MIIDDKETVLVTGANGFVGSRLCRRLIADGYRVIAGVRRGCDDSLIEELNLEYRYGDINQPETLPAMIENIDYIIHNAGLTKARSIEQFMKVNHEGTRHLLLAAEKNKKIKKFIYVSSLAAAGPSAKGKPLTEDDPPHPITEYGRSKAAGEKEVCDFSAKINTVSIRPPAIYGPGDKEMFSFFQILNNRLMPFLGNPGRKIQLVHVDDLCYGISCVLKAATKSGSIYFVAEEKGYSYGQLVGFIRKGVGRWALPLYLPGFTVKFIASISEGVMRRFGKAPMFTVEKANEILANWEVSTEKAARELGYRSRIAFPEGARQTVHWYREEGWL